MDRSRFLGLSAQNRRVLAIALPAVVELVLTSLTHFVDTIMVGRLGAYAISAVGITSQPKFVMLATFVALNVGTTALVARFRGQGNSKDIDIVAVQSLLLTLALALLFMVPGVLGARWMVTAMGASADTIVPATRYLTILMIGFVPTVLPIAVSALLRGVGETALSMRYNLLANGVNIVFNYLLIYGKFGFPALGVDGAAIATVIGNTAACAMALRTIIKGRPKERTPGVSAHVKLRLARETMKPDFSMIRRIIKIGVPSAGEQFIMRVGLLIYTITITSLGTMVFAAHQIVLTILNMSFVNGQAFGIAAASLAGQALGREDPREAREASAACQRIGALISTIMGLLMYIFRRQLVGLFSDQPEIMALGAGVMILAALVQPFQSSFQIYAGALRGAGDSLYPAISIGLGVLLIRPLASYALVHGLGMGLFGAWLALAADQTVRFVFILIRYRRGKWVHTKV